MNAIWWRINFGVICEWFILHQLSFVAKTELLVKTPRKAWDSTNNSSTEQSNLWPSSFAPNLIIIFNFFNQPHIQHHSVTFQNQTLIVFLKCVHMLHCYHASIILMPNQYESSNKVLSLTLCWLFVKFVFSCVFMQILCKLYVKLYTSGIKSKKKGQKLSQSTCEKLFFLQNLQSIEKGICESFKLMKKI